MKKSRLSKDADKRRETDIPRVIASVTMSLDGRISTRSRSDNPHLMNGVMMGFTGGKSTKSSVPIRIMVNEGGRFDPKSLGEVLADSGSLLILCTAKAIPNRVFRQLPPFVRVVEFPGGKIPLEALLMMLRSVWEVKLLLCEGESSLLKPLLAADVVEEIQLTLEPLILGGSHGMSLTGHPDGFLLKDRDRRFCLKSLKEEKKGGATSGSATLHYLRDREKTKP